MYSCTVHLYLFPYVSTALIEYLRTFVLPYNNGHVRVAFVVLGFYSRKYGSTCTAVRVHIDTFEGTFVLSYFCARTHTCTTTTTLSCYCIFDKGSLKYMYVYSCTRTVHYFLYTRSMITTLFPEVRVQYNFNLYGSTSGSTFESTKVLSKVPSKVSICLIN